MTTLPNHRYEVRLFAIARAMAGASTIEVELPERSTVADLKAAISSSFPRLAGLIGTFKISVNAEYADDSTSISPGADLAVIPPVSGG
jgi:molybdopterin converting factor small subunit